MSKKHPITGHLSGYWEQGWEGRIDYTLEPDRDEDRLDGVWPIPLQNGQYLRIFAADNTILWEGKLHFVQRRFYERAPADIKVWHDIKQRGISYRVWLSWFWQKPPLRAELTPLQ